MEQPLVSVVMATFNEPAGFITASVESILKQTYPRLELIIADDSTSEDTRDVIDAFAKKDSRVKVIRHKERMGFVRALNEGLCQASGKYIARMDGDDISLPDRIRKEVDYLEKHGHVDVLGGAMDIIDEKGTVVSERFYPLYGLKLHVWAVLRNPLAHPTVMLRSSLVRQGFCYDEGQKKAEDIELWLRLKVSGFRIANLPDKLLNYRVVGDLSLKRKRDQWIYNFKARKKNFTLRYPLFSVSSVLVSFAYTLIPQKLIGYMYKRENRKRLGKTE
ncbi:glycosyltransferase [Phocaeicola plebeius]|uniref:glycosyltransferase n=1 Tax=Phocaeicola plebeius TaxID=310297 RepID=UPI0026F1F713|nr:glycosyltransferase [Phocaeicola plebeius]